MVVHPRISTGSCLTYQSHPDECTFLCVLTVLQFDDIPISSTQSLPTEYHRFTFTDGMQVVSQRTTNSTSTSGSQVLQINPWDFAEIGFEQHRDKQCFIFDLHSLKLGCTSASGQCDFVITGRRWKGSDDVEANDQEITVSACLDLASCTLDPVIIPPIIGTGLESIVIEPQGEQTSWIDDVQTSWTDHGCGAAACRSQVPKTVKRRIRWGARG